ncbi:12506_t:CDS:1, partial [Funneliformis mosseae]
MDDLSNKNVQKSLSNVMIITFQVCLHSRKEGLWKELEEDKFHKQTSEP